MEIHQERLESLCRTCKKLTTDVKGWHEVPSHDKVLRAAWIHVMRRDPPYPSQKNFVLCGLHFADECFCVIVVI